LYYLTVPAYGDYDILTVLSDISLKHTSGSAGGAMPLGAMNVQTADYDNKSKKMCSKKNSSLLK
jgi:hypothetical protein